MFRVLGFWEKPSVDVARELMSKDSAWNTFVMVGHVRAFLELSRRTIPDVLEAVGRARPWNGAEAHLEESAYDQVPSSDFSRQVLSAAVARLLVLRVCELGWSDLGHPERVVAPSSGTASAHPGSTRGYSASPPALCQQELRLWHSDSGPHCLSDGEMDGEETRTHSLFARTHVELMATDRILSKKFVHFLYQEPAFGAFGDFNDFLESISCEASKTCQVCGSSPMPGIHTFCFSSLQGLSEIVVQILYHSRKNVNCCQHGN